MYARAKIGGFLHLSIGEEATIVGSARALRDDDYLISTYRSHGHALVRGTPPENVMAELFGRVDGCSRGRGGSMHMFDLARRFMGGYGIVGGNLPIAGGHRAAPATTAGHRRGDAVHVRRRRLQPGHLRRDAEPGGAVAAAGRLHGHQQPVRHGHRAARATRRSPTCSARARASACRACAATAWTCSTPTRSSSRPCARVREERRPLLVEAVTYRFRGHSMADPEQYRTQGGGRAVARARPDPGVRRAAAARGRDRRSSELERIDARGDRAGGRGGGVRREPRRSRRPSRSTTTCTCSSDAVRGSYSVETTERAAPASRRRDGAARRRRATTRSPSRSPSARRRRGRRRGRRGRLLMAADALPRGARRGAARGAQPRRAGGADGRGHRRVRRRLQGHRGPARGVRRERACATRRSPRTRSWGWAWARR